VASDSNRPVLPGKLGRLPYFQFSPTLPKSHDERARTDVIYGVDSLGGLLREVNFRLGGGPTKSGKS
jgi:hypothetical protein